MESIEISVGIDISAYTLNASWRRGEVIKSLATKQTLGAWRKLGRAILKEVEKPCQVRVVMEATSTYWMGVALYLHQIGMTIHVVNPKHAHHFAESYARHHKTDAIDAELLMRLGEERGDQLRVWTPPPACHEALYQRLVLRETLLKQRVALKNTLHAFEQRPNGLEVQPHTDEILAVLNHNIETLEKEIAHILKTCEWHEMASRLMSIKGIGVLTTAWLLVATVGFTTCESADQLASYAGLAPREHRSGSSVYKRPRLPHTGHTRLRRNLFMAARSASVHSPRMKAHFDQMVERGKPKKVARCAIARKLVVIAFALIRKGEFYQDDFHLQHQIPA